MKTAPFLYHASITGDLHHDFILEKCNTFLDLAIISLCEQGQSMILVHMQTYSVMIIDDEPPIRYGIKKAIDWQAISCRVTALCASGKEALAEIDAGTIPDIMITDIRMNDMTGLELIKELRLRQVETRFIILTGYDDFAYAKEAIKLSVDDFLLKPLSRSELLSSLKKAISRIPERILRTENNTTHLKAIARLQFLQDLIAGDVRDAQQFKQAKQEFSLSTDEKPCTLLVFESNGELETSMTEKILAPCKGLDCDVFRPKNQSLAILSNLTEQNARHLASIIAESVKDEQLDIGVSDEAASPLMLHAVYQKMQLALSYAIYHEGKSRVYTSDAIVTANPDFLSGDIDTQALATCIMDRDKKKIDA